MDFGGLEEVDAKHGDALVRFAASLVGAADAEDLVAGVMATMLRSPEREIDDVRAYLYRR